MDGSEAPHASAQGIFTASADTLFATFFSIRFSIFPSSS